MEALGASPVFGTAISTSSTLLSKSPLRSNRDVSLLFLRFQPLRPSRCRKLRVLARLGQPSRRSNSLRQKLVPREEYDQVRRILEASNPDSNPQNYEKAHPSVNRQGEEDVGEIDGSADPNLVGMSAQLNSVGDSLGRQKGPCDSVLWNKLENWVEQYKEESNFWGIGSGSIFTVYQDVNGKVLRVSVNEDEIIKRSGKEGWPFKLKESRDGYKDVNAKISRAKLMAKEIESGEYNLSGNSSIAKFVIEGKRSSYVIDGFRSASLVGKPFVKILPQIGFTVLCGYFAFWAVKNLLFADSRTEVTREEKEMLRRKMKSRMERDMVQKGTVEVLKDVPELLVGSDKRPQLDKDELMKSIKAKASRESLMVSDLHSHFDDQDQEFKYKVREIREMVRQVHELERQDHQIDNEGGENDVSPVLLAGKNQVVASESNADLETDSVANGSDADGIPQINIPEDDSNILEFSQVMEDNKVLGEKGAESISNALGGESGKAFGVNGALKAASTDNAEMTIGGCLNSIPMKVAADCFDLKVNVDESNTEISKNGQKFEQNINNKGNNKLWTSESREENDFHHYPLDNSSSSSKSSIRKKPKIIKSVKEAREYLSQKHAISVNAFHQKSHFKKQQALEDSSAVYDDKVKVKESQSLDVITKTIGSCKDAKGKTVLLESHANMIVDSVTKATFHKNINESNLHVIGIANKEAPVEVGEITIFRDEEQDPLTDNPDREPGKPHCTNGAANPSSLDIENSETGCSSYISIESHSMDKDSLTNATKPSLQFSKKEQATQKVRTEITENFSDRYCRKEIESHPSDAKPSSQNITYARRKPSTAKSVRASSVCREYSSPTDKGLHHQGDQLSCPRAGSDVHGTTNSKKTNGTESQTVDRKSSGPEFSRLDMMSEPSSAVSYSEDPIIRTEKTGDNFDAEQDMNSDSSSRSSISQVSNDAKCNTKAKQVEGDKSWVENNFHEFDPIIKKIALGYKENYMMAKEKLQEQKVVSSGLSELGLMEDDGELDWMNDDGVRKIVFQVRENELAGRDPFHMMDADDQVAFFKGLEKKAEKVNEKLSGLHEYIHSRVENINYGADGISLYDPLEKIIPRWKGPPISEDPEFLNNFTKHQQRIVEDDVERSHIASKDGQDSLQKPKELSNSDGNSPFSPVHNVRKISQNEASVIPKTIIECSDGSSRAGKKLGKEHWEHTKKWSREFLELYNAETDPEIKSIMKDMGKDLDKWITEKEIQEVGDLMTRIPKRRRRYIEKKLDKLKREMEMFGPQAVVSKYREYSEEKEEDYLWWLDLPFVLCIEIYRVEDDVPKIGFYSLEMAPDLELSPKQQHVIGFEDPGDSKNFCYIIQAHMDMLGNGSAFVVARPPKDAFREAKADGFSVTVIRKGELKLNVDQTLEEVEEEIIEIGSKMYHDKIMHERSVDMGALMKGVFGAGKTTKRRPKRVLRKASNHESTLP